MNTVKIIEAARNILTDLDELGKNIYRGTLKIEDKVAGVCFIDLENDKKENFDEYQEKLISKEFYSNPGSIQWNYYLFLLNDQLSDNEVLDIESDDKYARKYVLNEKEFIEFFKIEETEKVTQPNIISEWKKALEEVDLQEVYTDETYVAVFERFSSNKTKKEVAASSTKGKQDVSKIQFINKLILKDNYRAYPKTNREFTFGKVNLFKGINGVGKTSVFEGIELMLCGKSFRNVNQSNPEGCLEAVFNGVAKSEQYKGNNQALYQSRDFKWYSSTYTRGNNLCNSFNRFNYFNADAAHSFASSKTEEEVMDALYSIVLGPEFGYIQERCTKMIERIRPELNRLRDSLDSANGEVIADKKMVDAYIEPESVRYIREKIKEEIKAIGFRQPDLNIATGQTQIEDLNGQIHIALHNLAERNFQYDSQADFNIALEAFNVKKQTFDTLLENVKSLGHTSTIMLNAQKELERNLELLERSMDYLSDAQYLELDGLAVKLTDQHYLKSKTDFVSGLLRDVDLEKFKSSTPISEMELVERSLLETLKRDSLALRGTINNELEKMGKVDGLIKELKVKGAEYLLAAPLATECPLCSTSFERELLEQRINLLLKIDQPEIDKFQEDNNRLARWTEDQAAVEKRLAIIEKIKNAYQSFFGLDKPLGTMTEILKEIKDIIIRSEGVDKELDRLKSIEHFGTIAGKSESELSALKSKITQVFADELEFHLNEIGSFKARHSVLEKNLADKKDELEKNIAARYNMGLEIKLLLGLPTEAPTDAKAAEQKLESDKKNLDLYAAYIERIKILVELDETAKFSELKNKSDILSQSIQSLKDAINAEFLVKQARERLEKNEKILTQNTPKKNRFEKAYNRLLELTSKEAAERVEEFFKDNLKEIIDIFKSIHVPREFSNLKFENKRLTLIDNEGNDQRYITQISTGQRSALALSIFLSLNNKLANGPDLIMFDDPIAFIDDLNALSFLDYLRLHVLKSGKQIFFATANNRLAHLFEKKFAFLEDEDFKQWHLERN